VKSGPRRVLTFVDLFSGCGGFSLGLVAAGWKGLFALEKNEAAFETFSRNLLRRFDWPEVLEKKHWKIEDFLRDHESRLGELTGDLDLVAGGPPCQGFSFAGARVASDPRNALFERYVDFVTAAQPRFVLIENVRGIAVAHGKTALRSCDAEGTSSPFSDRILASLGTQYHMARPQLVVCSSFGLPQRRPRVIFFGVRKDLPYQPDCFFSHLERVRRDIRRRFRLKAGGVVTVQQAISDLRQRDDIHLSEGVRFLFGKYGRGKPTIYQAWMRKGAVGAPPNHRFANHREPTRRRFEEILNDERIRKGVSLPEKVRAEMKIGKHVVVPLHPEMVAHTLTTLPDDLIHYEEPRILTVREYARLQSFPDDFVFCGPYTTGGKRRVEQCPQYTQVGNAVPPLLSEALGLALVRLIEHKSPER
jgi:DNA (cytosine-5)-methyltransferase 1